MKAYCAGVQAHVQHVSEGVIPNVTADDGFRLYMGVRRNSIALLATLAVTE